MNPVMSPVPPAVIRNNDWRRLAPPSTDDFIPEVPVSVVVPYYEAPDALDLTLAALERQTYPCDLFEVIVVDDGSSVPLEPPVSSPLDVRVIHQEDLGFGLARARNNGARAARHPILVFLDCDMLPEAGWLAAHARWHHVAGDLLTLGFRAHVDVGGIDTAAIRNRTGTLAALFKGRRVDRPEWIEFHMARTDELTMESDDIFRVVTGGNLGVSRWFFDQVGGFDESFTRWGMEDTEFGYRAFTRGGPLVPVRDALCWHQGEGADPSLAEQASLDIQRAKASHLIAHPHFRRAKPGRSFTVPSYVVTIDPGDRPPAVVFAAAQEIVSNTIHDLVVWIGERPGDPGYEWLEHHLAPDPRVFFGAVGGAIERFPLSAFHIGIPAGMTVDRRIVQRLRDGLGTGAAAMATLGDGSGISITRTWILHRAQRTGENLDELGEIMPLSLSDLVLRRKTPMPLAGLRLRGSPLGAKVALVLSQLARVRNPRQALTFARWFVSALSRRLFNVLRRLWARVRPAPRDPGEQAEYPLGVEIAVVGHRARDAFSGSSRVHLSPDGEETDLVVADTADGLAGAGLDGAPPAVILANESPLLAVPAFDSEQTNPVDWTWHVGGQVGALSEIGLPVGMEIDAVVDLADRKVLSRLHHLEDCRPFHPDTICRAATLASLAATGLVIHVNEDDPELEAHLGAELYGAMRNEDISQAGLRTRERLSIDMRRAALRTHSLRARARQVAAAAGLAASPGLPDVSILLATRRPDLLDRCLDVAAAQTYPRLQLVLALHGEGFPDMIDTSTCPFPVEVVRAPSDKLFGEVLNQATRAADGTLLTKMDDDDHYGAEHVWDLVLAHDYSRANLVAKAAEFVYLASSDTTIHRMIGGGESRSDNPTIAGGAMIISAGDLEEAGGWRRIPRWVDQALLKDVIREGGDAYRTHGHGYLLVRHGDEHTWKSPDSYFLRHAQETRAGCDLAFAGVE
jgi:GT2 family glycosyltransferase